MLIPNILIQFSMRILIVKDGRVVEGQEARFQKLVQDNIAECKENDAWLYDNIPSYQEERDANPITDWEKETREELLSIAVKHDNGEIYVEE